MKNTTMKTRGAASLAAFCAALLASPAMAQQDGEACVPPACPEVPTSTPRQYTGLVMKPTVVSAYVDVGQFGEAKNIENDESIAGEPLTRTGAYITVNGVYDDRLEVRLTTGGLFWYPSPEQPDPAYRLVRFGPGVGQAQAIYSFGEDPLNNPAAKLQFGLFPVKYTSSHNLGEYLFRSGTYPGYLITGGWSFLNSASYLAQGVRFSLPTLGGMLTHDFTLFMERGVEPIHNFTPGYMFTARPNAMFEFGGGAVYAHGLAWRPSKLSPKDELNAYSETTGRPVHNEEASNLSPCGEYYKTERGSPPQIIDPIDSTVIVLRPGAPAADRSDCGHYTFQGVKLMGRASANLGSLIGHPKVGPEDFKVYAEIALLGVKDYPFYYEKKTERMPVMFGLNIPTFGILDRLSAEVEYRKSRFQNTFGLTYLQTIPVPLDNESVAPWQQFGAAPEETDDDWKWSFYGRKQLTKGVTIHAQAASDHLRHTDYEAKIHAQPSTVTYKEWYYILRLDFGLF